MNVPVAASAPTNDGPLPGTVSGVNGSPEPDLFPDNDANNPGVYVPRGNVGGSPHDLDERVEAVGPETRAAAANPVRPQAASRGQAKSKRRYLAVHHDLNADPDFARVWEDPELLGHWLRLAVMANSTWPDAATVPRYVPDDVLVRLAQHGALTREPNDCYRMPVHVDAVREQGAEWGRQGADTRWNDSSAIAPLSGAYSRPNAQDRTGTGAEHQQVQEQNGKPPYGPPRGGALRDRPSGPAASSFARAQYVTTTGSDIPTEKMGMFIDSLATEHGTSKVTTAMQTEWQHDPTARGFLVSMAK